MKLFAMSFATNSGSVSGGLVASESVKMGGLGVAAPSGVTAFEPTTETSLRDLSNSRAVIVRLPAGSVGGRLKSLGIFEGQRIELARRGNPLIVKAAGGRVAIASEIACDIVVQAFD